MTLGQEADIGHDDDEPPPNRVYAAKHRDSILRLSRGGMSRQSRERIYGKSAVTQVLGEPQA